MTPQAYCRGLATLEKYDFVRKRPVRNNPRVIDYLMLNPILVQIGSKQDAEKLGVEYREMPSEKVVSPMPIRVAKSPAQNASSDDPDAKSRSAPLTIPTPSASPKASTSNSVDRSAEAPRFDLEFDVDLGIPTNHPWDPKVD
jgi:hypothetical protein